MKVVALVSGGKDSCYNMVECVKHGHQIVCIANLAPTNRSTQELDSWMFQTVGHNVVSAIAECMDVPLYQGDLHGIAHQKTLDYNSSSTESTHEVNDEVEDLYNLLLRIKTEIPNVSGVSCGAILSDYQRNRVENVCSRLGLTSLAYLWRRDQSELLDEMIQNGVCSILLKTACMGLDPRKDCGKTLAQLQPKLEKLKMTTGVNVCGEGGEYETFTLDCTVFKKRIVIDKSSIVIDSEDMFAPVGYLLIEEYHLEEKDINDVEVCQAQNITGSAWTASKPLEQANLSEQLSQLKPAIEVRVSSKCTSIYHEYYYISAEYNASIAQISDDVYLQTMALFKQVLEELDKVDFTTRELVHNVAVLKEMSDFQSFNIAYSSHFGQQPASRVCIADNTINGRVKLECLAAKRMAQNEQEEHDSNSMKKVLHVQSISHWAPACIGPYSQATKVDHVIRAAGQIALKPNTMQIDSNTDQMEQCVLNIQNTLDAIDSSVDSIIRCIVYVDEQRSGDIEPLAKQLRYKNGLPVIFSSVTGLPRGASVEVHVHSASNMSQVTRSSTNDNIHTVLVNSLTIHQLRLDSDNPLSMLGDYIRSVNGKVAILRVFANSTEVYQKIREQYTNYVTSYYQSTTASHSAIVEIECFV